MAKGKPQSRKDFEAAIIARAWKEPDYRKRLLSDPKGALKEELDKLYKGAALPDGINIHVHEEGPNDVHLVLPRNPQELTQQDLSPEDLDSVAGGTGIGLIANVVTTSVQNVQQVVAVNLDLVTAVNYNELVVASVINNANVNLVANVASTSVR